MRDFKSVIAEFSPSWFAVVMGTGVFATSTHLMNSSHPSPALDYLVRILVPLNFIFFFIILIPWSLRWILFTQNAIEDLKHPVRGNFYVTMGIGSLALSLNLSLFGMKDVAYGFWLLGSGAVVFFQVLVMFLTFVGERVKLEHISPVWFLGTTGLLLIPSSGIAILGGDMNSYHLLVFDFSFGTGFLLYFALLAIWLYRFILHEPLKGELLPLFWINMGPIGAVITTLATYFSTFPGEIGVSKFFAMVFLGFGMWWFLISIMVTLYYVKKVHISYRSVWWSFTFPLGQYLVGVLYLNSSLNYESLDSFSILLYGVLIFLWLLNVLMTLVYFKDRIKK